MQASLDTLAALDRYRRATNFLAAGQVYLQDNVLLDEPLRPEHIKPRLLGHWGTCPGINLVYAHLNHLIRNHADAEVLLITGPGHGAAANLANLYLEGTLTRFYPELTLDREGLARLVRGFSWPGGFPSHLTPGTPGCIHEGGELGYVLATAFGAAFDNPDLLVACVVGDGEAETGPTAAAWHSVKYLDPVTSGAVLPILHLNSFKISSPTIFGTMTQPELEALFSGYGYAPMFVTGPAYDAAMAAALEQAYTRIRDIQRQARAGGLRIHNRWPLLIVCTPKGWTGIKQADGHAVEGSFRAHQVPAKDARTNPEHLALLEEWLRSYRPDELFDADGRPMADILAQCPQGERRIGMSRHAFGRVRAPLDLPVWQGYGFDVTNPGTERTSGMAALGDYLRDTMRRSETARNFRIVCPDELESNRLDAVLEATPRAYAWPLPPNAEHLAPDGRVLEILSEHTCQGWLQGYLLTGRYGLFPCYEAFIAIVDSMVNQYAKFLKQASEVKWREPVPSLTYLLTSESWRQDHNGYSHQGPGFIDHLLNKKASAVRVYLPPDANCVLSTLDHCLRSTDYINLVIASKQPLPLYLDPKAAQEHCDAGASVWKWASTDDGADPDVVLVAIGDIMSQEVLAAVALLRADLPGLHVRVVNVCDLMILDQQGDHPHGLTDEAFTGLFTADRPVIVAFHGYPNAVKALLWGRPNPQHFTITGYREEGTTTTPLDMLIRNGASRYQLAMQALGAATRMPAEQTQPLLKRYERTLRDHRAYIEQHGDDPPEVRDWSWQ